MKAEAGSQWPRVTPNTSPHSPSSLAEKLFPGQCYFCPSVSRRRGLHSPALHLPAVPSQSLGRQAEIASDAGCGRHQRMKKGDSGAGATAAVIGGGGRGGGWGIETGLEVDWMKVGIGTGLGLGWSVRVKAGDEDGEKVGVGMR